MGALVNQFYSLMFTCMQTLKLTFFLFSIINTNYLGFVWPYFWKLTFKNCFLFFNLETIFKNIFQKIWLNEFIYFFVFKKLVKTTLTCSLKIVSKEQH